MKKTYVFLAVFSQIFVATGVFSQENQTQPDVKISCPDPSSLLSSLPNHSPGYSYSTITAKTKSSDGTPIEWFGFVVFSNPNVPSLLPQTNLTHIEAYESGTKFECAYRYIDNNKPLPGVPSASFSLTMSPAPKSLNELYNGKYNFKLSNDNTRCDFSKASCKIIGTPVDTTGQKSL